MSVTNHYSATAGEVVAALRERGYAASIEEAEYGPAIVWDGEPRAPGGVRRHGVYFRQEGDILTIEKGCSGMWNGQDTVEACMPARSLIWSD